MTIQNIEDVMSRIMGLNKNLTEQSLNTLLSASGWDAEDIQEGLRIFRNLSQAQAKTISPIINTIDITEPQTQNTNLESSENKIQVNIQSSDTQNNPVLESKINISTENKSQSENQNINLVTPSTLEVENKVEKENSNIKSVIVISLTLILILIILIGAYFYLDSMQNSKRPSVENVKINTNSVSNISVPTPSAISVSDKAANNLNSNPTPDILLLQQQVSSAQKEILDLKDRVQKLSNSSSTNGNGNPKYITLKGRSGRGISNVAATSTGFIINYTDNTKSFVPFSTTTILNIINAQSLCLNNLSSSDNQNSQNNLNTNCLDQESLLRLLSR